MAEQTNEHTAEAEAIEKYKTLIAELDGKLNAAQKKHIDGLKREAMASAGYSDEQIERYKSHIEADNIAESVNELTKDIKPAEAQEYADPTPFNPAKARPRTSLDNAQAVAKDIYKRLKKERRI